MRHAGPVRPARVDEARRWKTGAVAEIDPDDDTLHRYVLHWYRYDLERRERRNTAVAAYDDEREFTRHFDELRARLEEPKASGLSEPVEDISGVVLPNSRARAQSTRLQEQVIRRRARKTTT